MWKSRPRTSSPSRKSWRRSRSITKGSNAESIDPRLRRVDGTRSASTSAVQAVTTSARMNCSPRRVGRHVGPVARPDEDGVGVSIDPRSRARKVLTFWTRGPPAPMIMVAMGTDQHLGHCRRALELGDQRRRHGAGELSDRASCAPAAVRSGSQVCHRLRRVSGHDCWRQRRFPSRRATASTVEQQGRVLPRMLEAIEGAPGLDHYRGLRVLGEEGRPLVRAILATRKRPGSRSRSCSMHWFCEHRSRS